MKILTTIILAFICHFVTAQNKHVSINYRFGSAIENFQIPVVLKTTRLEHRKIRPVWDQGLVVLYSPPLWEKYGIYYNFGGEISTSKYYQPIVERKYTYNIDNIELTHTRLGMIIGLEKHLKFYEDRCAINFGVNAAYRLFPQQYKQYAKGYHFNNEHWIEFSYTLNVYRDDYHRNEANIGQSGKVGLDFFTHVSFAINNSSAVNFGLNLTTHNIFFYEFRHSIRYYQDGTEGPIYWYTDLGIEPKYKYGIQTTNLYLSFGYTYTWTK